jgi:hypothetical protein
MIERVRAVLVTPADQVLPIRRERPATATYTHFLVKALKSSVSLFALSDLRRTGGTDAAARQGR